MINEDYFLILVPFVFLPTTFTTGFDRSNNSAHVSAGDEATTSESKETKEKNDSEEEQEDEESAGMYKQ